MQPNRSFRALKVDSGTFNPRPVRCGPILRLKKRSGRGVTTLRPTLRRPVHGRRVVFHIAGTLVRSDLAEGPKFHSMGRMSCQLEGPGRGLQPAAGGSGV